MHVLQGAYYASESAADRYCDAVVEAAEKVKGKPKEAPVEAHKAAYEIYGGGKNYQGGIQSLAEACRIHKMDCIRASNLLGAIYANAGYVGMHPVRMCRANPQDKTMGYNGHTITCVIDGKKSRTLDPLTPKAGPSFESVYKSTKEAASVSLGYRCLNSYMAGKFYFPNNGMKDVQLNMPHYGLKKMGL
jgi:hypothetical protein